MWIFKTGRKAGRRSRTAGEFTEKKGEGTEKTFWKMERNLSQEGKRVHKKDVSP